jgi:hypothetical protein
LLNALAIDDTHEIKKDSELVDLCERVGELSINEKVILSSPITWLKRYISVFHTIPSRKIVVHPDKNNEILTYASKTEERKNLKSNGDIEAAKTNNQQHELQQLNSNMPRFSLKKPLSLALDSKIMKSIRNVLGERRDEENNPQKSLERRLKSMESEMAMQRALIQRLVDRTN